MICRHHPWKYWPSFIKASWKWHRFKHSERHMNLSRVDLLNCRTTSKWALMWSQTDKLIQLWKQGHSAPVFYLHMMDLYLCELGNSLSIKTLALCIKDITSSMVKERKRHSKWCEWSPWSISPWSIRFQCRMSFLDNAAYFRQCCILGLVFQTQYHLNYT